MTKSILRLIPIFLLAGCAPLRDAQIEGKIANFESDAKQAFVAEDLVRSKKALDEMIQLKPDWSGYRRAAELTMGAGDGKLLESRRDFAERCFHASIDYVQAAFKAFPNLKPDSQAALYSVLGTDYGYLHDVPSMVANFEQALKLQPTNWEIMNTYAYLLVEKEGDLDRALAVAHKAWQMSSNNPAVQDTYGWALTNVGRNRDAIEQLESALGRTRSDDGTVAFHLGVAYFQDRRFADAKTVLEKAEHLIRDPEALARIRQTFTLMPARYRH